MNRILGVSAACLMLMMSCVSSWAYPQYVQQQGGNDPGGCRLKIRTELGLAPYTGNSHPAFWGKVRACLNGGGGGGGETRNIAKKEVIASRSGETRNERRDKQAEARARAAKIASRSGPDQKTQSAAERIQTAVGSQGLASQQAVPVQQALAAPVSDPGPSVSFGRRVALVIGNSEYEKVPSLPNAVNDAQAFASTLRTTGFQSVTLKTNLTRDQTIAAISEFATLADGADWATIYYSGHGIEYRGMNYVIPIDAKLKVDRDIDLEAVDIGKLSLAIDSAKRLKLVILDACRDNPFTDQMKRTVATRSLSRGLARVEPEAGMLIVYSAKHGEVALDGTGSNSPFTTALLKRMQTPNVELRRVFDLVRDDVMVATARRQQPFSYGSLSGSEDFYFMAKQ